MRLKIMGFGFFGIVLTLAWWGFIAWLIIGFVWPWLAAILRANGIKGV